MRGAALIVMSALAMPAVAQQRIADALSFADIASGSLTGLAAACDRTRQAPRGGVSPMLPELPMLPMGGPSPSNRQFYFAAAAGAAVLDMDAALRDGHGVGQFQARAHFVPRALCWLDAFAVVYASTSSALAGTVQLRILPLPDSWFAPAIELAAGQIFGGANEPGQIDLKFSARVSATTPNLYALTIGRVTEMLLHEQSPKLDFRARLFVGRASFAEDYWMQNVVCADVGGNTCLRMSRNGGGVYNEIGGTAFVSMLHIPVSLLATTEQIDGVIPISRPPARESLGLAFRLPGHNRNLWLVARVERFRDRVTTNGFRLELTQLLLGAR